MTDPIYLVNMIFGGGRVCEKMMSRKLNPTMDQDQGDPIHSLDAS
uniref:Uncharacterized protein n=1 Tax=viral metagenome TaxID=1070528 RepID=A0A6C0EKX2_9ZZZZ